MSAYSNSSSPTILFMGTSPFAADILSDVSGTLDVRGVITVPDSVRSRGKRLEPSAVKQVASELGIDVICPDTLKDLDAQEWVSKIAPDFIVVASYGKLLPESILSIPKLGCLNVHASLLPRWRGAAPIERAILAGDQQIGVCIMEMEPTLDTGDYCICRSISAGGLTVAEASSELASLGASALVSAIAQIANGNARWTKQDDSLVTYAEKISKGELNLSPKLSAIENWRHVLASSPAHKAKCKLLGRDIVVISANLPANGLASSESILQKSPGEVVVEDKSVILICSEGALVLDSIRPSGKKEMDAYSFYLGSKQSLPTDEPLLWGECE